jgi:nucleoid DNA-binding protein
VEDQMNKLDLIEALQNGTDLTKIETEAVVKLFFNEMANTLAKGDRVGNKTLPKELNRFIS